MTPPPDGVSCKEVKKTAPFGAVGSYFIFFLMNAGLPAEISRRWFVSLRPAQGILEMVTSFSSG